MTWPTPGGVHNAGFGGGEGPVMSCVMTLLVVGSGLEAQWMLLGCLWRLSRDGKILFYCR